MVEELITTQWPTIYVMVGFMCQPEWVTERPDIWLNIISGVCMGVFWEEINIRIGRLSPTDCHPQCQRPHPIR